MSSMTARQQEIKDLLDQGLGARDIARQLGITRNAVYQQIQRMRKNGDLASNYTPTGVPTREGQGQPGYDMMARLLKDGHGDADELGDVQTAGALALLHELRAVRDELGEIVQRLSLLVPR